MELWTTAHSVPRIINTNFSHHNGKLAQLPVLLTSFPPVSVTVLFILCFFLYKSIHQTHFKQLALQFTLKSVSLSHLSWFQCVGNGIILTCSSAFQRLFCHYSQGIQLLFCTPLAGKGYLWADNLSYIPCLLTAENHCMRNKQALCSLVAQGSGGIEADSVTEVEKLHKVKYFGLKIQSDRKYGKHLKKDNQGGAAEKQMSELICLQWKSTQNKDLEEDKETRNAVTCRVSGTGLMWIRRKWYKTKRKWKRKFSPWWWMHVSVHTSRTHEKSKCMNKRWMTVFSCAIIQQTKSRHFFT